MRHSRLIVCAVAAVLLTACSDDGVVAGNGSPGSGGASASAEPSGGAGSTSDEVSKPPAFEDFPGESLLYVDSGMKLGVQTKAIDSTWAPEVLGQSADPGHHWLAVWVAVTPELPDRGADAVRINGQLVVRHEPVGGVCTANQPPKDTGYCYLEGWLASSLVALEDSDWRNYSWEQQRYTNTDIARGETRIGQVAFLIEDTMTTTEFELCAPSKQYSVEYVRFPCIPVKAPDGSR